MICAVGSLVNRSARRSSTKRPGFDYAGPKWPKGRRPPAADPAQHQPVGVLYERFAANVLPIIRDIQAAGFTSLNAIAGQLNSPKVATANRGQWRPVQVRHILDRAPADERRRPRSARTTAPAAR
jgi:hypothetical protein